MKECVLYSLLSFFAGIVITYIFAVIKINSKKKELDEKSLELVRLQTQLEQTGNLSGIFKQIALETLDQTNEKILEKNQTLLSPLKDEIKEFKEKVELLKNTGIENSSALKEKIDTLRKDSLDLRNQAQALTESLKINSKNRGILGEIVLEQILITSGLINQNDDPVLGNYITQKGFKDIQNPQDRALIPDAVIFYPDAKKHIVIDSKCPLNYFQEFIKTGEDDFLNKFYNGLQDMIEELSGKYNSLKGLSTPDFKILFIPFETAYLYTFENSELVMSANKKNIVIAGPSTLVAILKIIKECWDTRKITDNLQNMQTLGNSIYDSFCTFLNKLESVESKFLSLQTAFQEAFTTAKGTRGLVSKFEKFKNMGLNPNKQIEGKYKVAE